MELIIELIISGWKAIYQSTHSIQIFIGLTHNN